MKKLFICFLLAIFTLIPLQPINSASGPEIVIEKLDVSRSGYVKITGHITGNVPLNSQVGFVMADTAMFNSSHKIIENRFNMDYLAGLEQASTGNNGVFVIEFRVDSKWSEKTLGIAMNSNANTAYHYETVDMPELPPGIEAVANNSVLYGRDIYNVESKYYTPDNIATSMLEGNNIYYKMGDNWYNLMDNAATSNAYLVPRNAAKTSEIEKIKPKYYYHTDKMELHYLFM